MELEEAIEYVKFLIRDLKADNYNKNFIKALETALNYIKNSIPKKKIEDKIGKLKEEYMSILNEYGNTDVDVIINIPNENVRKHLGKLVERILVLQELLED